MSGASAVPAVRWEGPHLALDLPGARVLFTTRRGGVSGGPFATLNLGLWTEDDPAAVGENRERVAAQVGIPRDRFAQGRQVHGTSVVRLDGAPAAVPPEADGHATGRAGVAPVVLTADCLPVALAARGAVAMVHAGWRGLADGVLEEGVRALREVGGEGAAYAAIGPGAGGCCYEVGEEVHARFGGEGRTPGRRIDLKAIAGTRLRAAGVEEVGDAGLCTMCSDPGLFFSHRRDGRITGRQAGIAWLI